MSIKIHNYLFTGPFPIDKTSRRANHPETVFAILIKAGTAWDPVFQLLDLDRTGAAGIVFSAHPRAGTWVDGDGKSAAVYLLDIATQPDVAADLDAVVNSIRAKYTLPADLR